MRISYCDLFKRVRLLKAISLKQEWSLTMNLQKISTLSAPTMNKRFLSCVAILLLLFSCRKPGNNVTAFYYWKTGFKLSSKQAFLLQQSGNNIYLRFFDVNWNDDQHRAYPNAVVQLNQPVTGINITPVIYITNKTFQNIADTALNSLAAHCNKLVNTIATQNHISYTNIQVDCDWSLNTRGKYFGFLAAFKKLNQKQLQVTIRLHQVKYKGRTGIPPADGGVLMFYNMGKLNAVADQPNSIYNPDDADKYAGYINTYPLKLDIALPLFSWAIHIRDGHTIQVYGKMGRGQLDDQSNFEQTGTANSYRTKKSFFLEGIYIKQNDIFKLEETNLSTLNTAARQLNKNLPHQQNKTIIYYELANIDSSKFNAEALKQVSADL